MSRRLHLVHDTRLNFRGFLAARLIFTTVLLGVAVFFRPTDAALTPYLILFGGNAVLCFGGWEWFSRMPRRTYSLWILLTVGVVLDTALLKYTSGAEGEFTFLFFFSIGAAALLLGLSGSIWIALLATGGFVFLVRPEWTGIYSDAAMRSFIYGLNFALAAVLSSFLFERVRQRELTHHETLGKLEQTRLDTQAILDSLNTGLMVIDINQSMLYSNPRGLEILGLRPEATRQEVEQTVADGTPIGEMMKKVTAEKINGERLEVLQPSENGYKPIGLTASVMYDRNQDLRGYIILFSDLTKIKEQERRELNRERLAAVGLLARDLAHEIRNPLATVRGSVEMMRAEESCRPDQKRYLELALKESDRLNNLLREFLTFAQIDAVRKERGDLARLIRERTSAMPGSIKMRDHMPEAIPIDYDPSLMMLVVDAVVLALAEWAEANDVIDIDCEIGGQIILKFLLLQRTISSEVIRTAFQPFSNIHRESFGLALPTAMRAINAHGGSISLQSDPAVGTWFELEI